MNKPDSHYQGRYLSLLEINGWEYVSRSNATGVVVLVALTDERELVLVEQFRPPVGCSVIELPAGLVGDHSDKNESMLHAAKRELLEETGFESSRLEIMMTCPSSAGMSNELITIVRAQELVRVAPGGGDSTEDIIVHLVPLASVDNWLAERRVGGTMSDPKIFAAVHWIKQESL